MLGYRHVFHAGNHADVLKHVVVLQLLDHLVAKDKPFWYIDTHAGAGSYALDKGDAAAHGEYRNGAVRLWEAGALPAALERYVALLRMMNQRGQLRRYPGSPWIARAVARSQDRLWLHELHPSDHAQLAKAFAGSSCRVTNEDGLAALIRLLPPRPRRALVLIDPSWELREDYARVPRVLEQALHRFATGIYAIWYPLIDRREAHALPARLEALGAPRWLRTELRVAGSRGAGLRGSGMFVVNPPWTLEATLADALPRLVELLGQDRDAAWTLHCQTQ